MFFRKRKAPDRDSFPDAPAVTAAFRRVVTGHDPQGWSIVRSVDTLRPVTTELGEVAFAQVWATPEVPANLNDRSDGAGATGDRGGSLVRVVDFLPGRKSRLHRSWSIDYAIVVSGELELQLDSGMVEHLVAGDIVIQRGTSHLWRNAGEDPCRVVFVLVEALPVMVGGQLMPETDS